MLKQPVRPHPARLFFATPFSLLCALFFFILAPTFAHADDAPSPDTLVFANGDSLKGKLVSATGASVVFHSDMAGDLTIDWAKIKTIDAMEKFAVIKNGVKLSRKTPEGDVAQGTVAVSDKNIQVQTPSGTTTISTSDTQAIVPDADFQKTLYHEPGFFHGYTGALSLGAAVVSSTQNARNFNGALTLVRTVPNAAWVSPRNKTTLDASLIYGLQTQNANPALNIPYSSVKTDIIHGDLERDEYLSTRFYYLGYASADHNYSQGLAVQYVFGGGFGYTVLKDPKQELDVKTDLHYEKQQYVPSANTADNNLIGMDFAEMYTRKLPKGLGLTETGVITPSFNSPSAPTGKPSLGYPYSAAFTSLFTFPAYKNFAFNAGITDNYISNPAPGFNANSFQFTGGITYSFK
jgi:hypothetical protein